MHPCHSGKEREVEGGEKEGGRPLALETEVRYHRAFVRRHRMDGGAIEQGLGKAGGFTDLDVQPLLATRRQKR